MTLIIVAIGASFIAKHFVKHIDTQVSIPFQEYLRDLVFKPTLV